jgi:hypothetical protein
VTLKHYRGGDTEFRRQAVQAVAAKMSLIEGKGRGELETLLETRGPDDQEGGK